MSKTKSVKKIAVRMGDCPIVDPIERLRLISVLRPDLYRSFAALIEWGLSDQGHNLWSPLSTDERIAAIAEYDNRRAHDLTSRVGAR